MSLQINRIAALALAFFTFHMLLTGVAGNTYTLANDFISTPEQLYEDFSFFTAADPTAGSVVYVDAATAATSALFAIVEGKSSSPFTNGTQAVYVGVDTTNITPNGRPSVRITSNKSFNSGMLLIADIAHQPVGCGTWPALWLVGPSWPTNGEIDIIERVENQAENSMTLHTSEGCIVAASSSNYTGTLVTPNCWTSDPAQGNNAGCQIMSPANTASSGASFNAAGGGVFVTEWTTSAINIWLFPATAQVPASLTAANPSTAGLGVPAASWSSAGCDIETHFADLQIVLDTTFCGDWAGAVWESGGCAAQTGVGTCEEYVANYPEAFVEAFWEVRALSVYVAEGAAKMKGKRGEGGSWEGHEWEY